jgi:hypothetical protein
MKRSLTISAAIFAVACASGPEERSPSAEQRERMDERRAAAEGEPGSEPIPSQFDRDGDGQVENAELKKSGVSEGAIDKLDDDVDDNDGDDDRTSAHASDAEITERVREKIAAHDDLSTKAKNVRVSTDNGKVTLSGKVDSAVEKSKIDSCAREVAGADDVDNRIDVAR